MDEQKKNRLAAAITVNVILLIIILAAVIIYQLSEIVLFNNRKAEIQAEITRIEGLIENEEKDLEYLKSEDYLLYLALQMGYTFPKN